MPSYGEKKRRDMVRSILPSKHRKGARKDRAAVHRRARHADNQRIRSWTHEWEDWDESLGARPLGKSWEDELIDEVKWDRRNGDKDAPIMRWGPKVVAQYPIEDRYTRLKKLLGNDLGGRHALTHLRYDDDIVPPEKQTWRWYNYHDTRPVPPQRENVEAALRELIASGRHRWFNNVIVNGTPIAESRYLRNGEWHSRYSFARKLLGLHDIHSWVAEVFAHYRLRDYIISILSAEGVYKP